MEVNATEEEMKKYLENLNIEYQFSCYKENNGEGCCLLGEFFQNVKEDYVKAAAAFKRGCDKHDFAKSCFKYGGSLYRGRGVKRDEPKAFEYQSKACDLGWSQGCLVAGFQLSQKDAIDDPVAATKFFKRACNMESAEGCFHVAGIYHQGRGPIRPDSTKAFNYSLRACDYGEMQACANVSYMYKVGLGVAPDAKKSEAYRAKALDYKQQIERVRGFKMEQGIAQ